MTPIVVRRKKAPVKLTKEDTAKKSDKKPEDATLKPVPIPEFSKKKPTPPEKPKPPQPDKAQQHDIYLAEIAVLPAPEREIVSACYFLCFLINENRTTTPLFPMKDKVLEKIFRSGHECLTVSYIRRWDKLTYRLEPDANDRWESETGAKMDLIHLYRTPGCHVQFQRGYYDLYQFHTVIEPFRFLFFMPVELGLWIEEERLQKPRLHTNQTKELGLLRGQQIKVSKKSTGLTDERVGAELQRFLDAEMSR